MTKAEILKKIGNARYASRMAYFRLEGAAKEALLEKETERLIAKAEELNIPWEEIEKALLEANETAEMVADEEAKEIERLQMADADAYFDSLIAENRTFYTGELG